MECPISSVDGQDPEGLCAGYDDRSEVPLVQRQQVVAREAFSEYDYRSIGQSQPQIRIAFIIRDAASTAAESNPLQFVYASRDILENLELCFLTRDPLYQIIEFGQDKWREDPPLWLSRSSRDSLMVLIATIVVGE